MFFLIKLEDFFKCFRMEIIFVITFFRKIFKIFCKWVGKGIVLYFFCCDCLVIYCFVICSLFGFIYSLEILFRKFCILS